MKPDHEKQLEQAIGEKLRALPELSAPREIALRVMSTLATRAALPWYRRSWQTWSPAAKAVSLSLLLASFSGLSFVGWKVSEADTLTKLLPQIGDWLETLNVIWNTVQVLAGAALLALRKLSPNFFIVCALIGALTYAACIGVGTVLFRQSKKI